MIENKIGQLNKDKLIEKMNEYKEKHQTNKNDLFDKKLCQR